MDRIRAALWRRGAHGRTALDEIVRRGRTARGRDGQELSATLRLAEKWLRTFQRHTRTEGEADPILAALLDGAAADLASCRQERLVSGSLARELEDRLGRLRKEIAPASLYRVGHHGDFWPGNLYVADLAQEGKADVQAIDFEGYREGLAAEDAAYFLVHLEPFFAWPGFSRWRERASAAFLQGWLDGDPLDRAALDLCRIAKALQGLTRTEYGGWRERRRRGVLVSILRRSGAER